MLLRAAVRQALGTLGVSWPELVGPGERVLLKLNFIRESHANRPDEWEQIITHGSVIAAVAMEVAVALEGHETITLADAPQTDSDFEEICERVEIPKLRERRGRANPERFACCYTHEHYGQRMIRVFEEISEFRNFSRTEKNHA